jgi:putative sigma-54 modulation protein
LYTASKGDFVILAKRRDLCYTSLINKEYSGSPGEREELRMKFIILGKNIDVTEGLRSAVEDKIGKLEKYFAEDTEVHVTLSVEKDRQKIEVTIPVKGSIIRSEQVSNDMYVSIDLVEEIIERQLKKYKTRLTDREQGAGSFKQEYLDKDFMDEEEVKIIRTKKFDIKPMYPEDACVQMELLGHSFFVFCNAETDQVNVVYKRKGNTYGLIEPEV